LSEHSLGGAIDINPLINPWVHYGKVDPPEATQYADRNQPWKGAIYADDVVVRAFAAIGWAGAARGRLGRLPTLLGERALADSAGARRSGKRAISAVSHSGPGAPMAGP
jgi:hypothetical protein